MTHAFHQTKFRWTENLTSRFIQLRKENGNLFTGRKYSAQAGWEHILQQMRQEFPTIMADVHYRVLKKKWSNLLQQYKELKNPVHGDKNKSDDVSWPFYGAIDEVIGYGQLQRTDEDDVNPHEFLCLSVTPGDERISPEDEEDKLRQDSDDLEDNAAPSLLALQRIRNLNDDFSIEIERLPRAPIRRPRPSSRPSRIAQELRRRNASQVLVSRLPPATELSIKTVRSTSSVPGLRVRNFSSNKEEGSAEPRQFLRDALAVAKRNGSHRNAEYNYEEEDEEGEGEGEGEEEGEGEDEEEEEYYEDEEERDRPPRKLTRRIEAPKVHERHNCNLERRLEEFFEYTKRRDDENRHIMTRILNAVERIAEKD